MELSEILKFHFVFDAFDICTKYDDVFSAIEAEILPNFREIGERFSFGGEYEKELKQALMKFARSDRKKIGVAKILPRFTAQKITQILLEAGFLNLEKSHEKRPVKLHKNDKLPRILRRYQITDKVHFNDNFSRFWFRFIEPNLQILAQGEYEKVIGEIREDFDNYASFGYEILCRELLANYLNIDISQISSYWDKNSEIDIFAKFEGFLIVGECKYKERKISKNVLNELLTKCENSALAPDMVALFSKSGFSGELEKIKNDRILLFDIEDFKILL
ncbi:MULTISPECIES: DUF234 domain-containing protein [unclassified Campylobacter]|uniref:DUF234 domain-containing protein n=1 Tax=unclassified Campylobacter TaxID=2593542 RepID=UPI002FDC048E